MGITLVNRRNRCYDGIKLGWTVEVEKYRVSEYLFAGFEKATVPEPSKPVETNPTEPENLPKAPETNTVAPKYDEKKPTGKKVELKAVVDAKIPEPEDPKADEVPPTEPKTATEPTGEGEPLTVGEPETPVVGDESIPTPPAE